MPEVSTVPFGIELVQAPYLKFQVPCLNIFKSAVEYGDTNDLGAQNFKFYHEISKVSLKIRKIKTGSTNP
jgi:hypothetical protein